LLSLWLCMAPQANVRSFEASLREALVDHGFVLSSAGVPTRIDLRRLGETYVLNIEVPDEARLVIEARSLDALKSATPHIARALLEEIGPATLRIDGIETRTRPPPPPPGDGPPWLGLSLAGAGVAAVGAGAGAAMFISRPPTRGPMLDAVGVAATALSIVGAAGLGVGAYLVVGAVE
jgi:hypothetical protein